MRKKMARTIVSSMRPAAIENAEPDEERAHAVAATDVGHAEHDEDDDGDAEERGADDEAARRFGDGAGATELVDGAALDEAHEGGVDEQHDDAHGRRARARRRRCAAAPCA